MSRFFRSGKWKWAFYRSLKFRMQRDFYWKIKKKTHAHLKSRNELIKKKPKLCFVFKNNSELPFNCNSKCFSYKSNSHMFTARRKHLLTHDMKLRAHRVKSNVTFYTTECLSTDCWMLKVHIDGVDVSVFLQSRELQCIFIFFDTIDWILILLSGFLLHFTYFLFGCAKIVEKTPSLACVLCIEWCQKFFSFSLR